MGVGLVVCDHEGRVVAVLCAPMPYVHDPTVAEALAAWRLAELCIQLGHDKIILEGDSLEVVQAFRKESHYWGRYEHIVDDAKALLDSSAQWVIQHVRRSANAAAHHLAKYALHVSEEQVWIGECPRFIHEIVLAEQGRV